MCVCMYVCVHVFVYIYVCVCVVTVHVCVVCEYGVSLCGVQYVCGIYGVCMCVHVCVCMCLYSMCLCVHVCMCVYLCGVCMYVSVSIYVCGVCMCVCMLQLQESSSITFHLLIIFETGIFTEPGAHKFSLASWLLNHRILLLTSLISNLIRIFYQDLPRHGVRGNLKRLLREICRGKKETPVTSL